MTLLLFNAIVVDAACVPADEDTTHDGSVACAAGGAAIVATPLSAMVIPNATSFFTMAPTLGRMRSL